MKRSFALAGLLLLAAVALAGATFYQNPLWCNDQLIRFHLWRSNVRSEYLQAGAYRLHYFEAIPPNGSPGTPLVLIHGLGSRGEDWSPLIPTLAAAGFHVYAPDLLGYGRSAHPDTAYSISLEEQTMVDFMRAAHITHADVTGWSMGGWIAAALALDHPADVDRLVLYDSAGLTFQPSFPRDAFVPTDAAGLARLMALLTPHPATLPGFVVRASLRRISRQGAIVQQSMNSMESGSDLLDNRLVNIHQPTLIVWGMSDALIPPAVGQVMHDRIPYSNFIGILGCGHLAPGECAKPVLTGTLGFLTADPPPRNAELLLPGTAPAPEKVSAQSTR